MTSAIRSLALLAALAACADAGPPAPPEMSASACAAPDWRALGVEDGGAGRTKAAYETRLSLCGLRGDAAARDAYLSGYAEGLVSYCSYENGERLGRAGAPPTLTCPPHLERRFSDGYAAGASSSSSILTPNVGVSVGVGSGGWSGGGVSVWF